MRILAVAPYWAPEGGGLERYAHALLSRLARRGHDVRALAFTGASLPSDTVDGVPVERLAPRLRIGNTPLDPAFGGALQRALALHRPDVVVAHTPVPFPAEVAYAVAKRARVPFVVTYHAGRLRGSSPALDALAGIDRATFERRMLAGAQGLIAVSPFVRDHALAAHRHRVAVVPPGVDTRSFSPGAPPPEPNVLFVGPLSRSYRWKGVDVLWDAFGRVRAELPRARLTLVGDGGRLQEFRGKASDFPGAVRLAGRVPEADLVEHYRRASVVVLPSLTDAESFGMVLAEANACGRPVVGSRIGGIPDFVEDGVNGLLARPGDPDDLARGILSVLRDPAWADAMGARGRAKVVRDHDWDALAARTESVLQHVVEPPVAAPLA